MPRCVSTLSLVSLIAVCTNGVGAAAPKIDFAREIQPILAQRCYDCHGAEKAKGGLHLTSRQHALKGGESGEPALVPGHSAKSVLIQRITTDDENDVMPQKSERLSAAEIATLKRWIDEGADWPENLQHWAYVKPERPRVPALRDASTKLHNPIDHFVVARFPAELRQSPLTDKPRWLRRVTLDLIGLPPTPAELEAFLGDSTAQAHERVVDRLLASPHYGERWARPWLDLARYADSHGFQKDDLRDIWPYRDWVIRALNADMPFDQFTIQQLAGDLLAKDPNWKPETPGFTTVDAVVATGFHRTVPTNVEAGTDQEEGRVNQVFDRVNTTAAVWLGSTLECAQCHNHKYDPFSQKDYYQLFAYFNNTDRETEFSTPRAMASLKFTGPYLTLPDPEKDKKRPALEARLEEIEQQLTTERIAALQRVDAWEAKLASADATSATHPFDVSGFDSSGDSAHRVLADKSVLLLDEAPDRDTYTITVNTTLTGITAFKLEALTHPSLPGTGPGRGDAARPNFILNHIGVTAKDADNDQNVPVELVRATASFSQPKFGVELAIKSTIDNRKGWAVGGQFFRDHWAMFETKQPVGSAAGTTFTFTLVQNFGTGRTIGRVRLSAVTGNPNAPTLPAEIAAILRVPKAERTAAQTKKLNEHYFTQDEPLEKLRLAKLDVTQEIASVQGPRTLVMHELEQPRPSTVLKRGNFLDPGEPVQPGTPAVLHASPAATGGNRLDLARWLVSRDNPLVARVTVNRWWAEFFGRGIVSTPEDFGVKGEPPSHPELLDWLAVEFMERGWSMKHIHKLITLSATYRQSARLTPELIATDDQNKWLARGPRFRLDAETIRDNALAAAGLLSLKQGGPPVRPYQPPGLWENKVGGDKISYEVSSGEDAWRRGIYTVWKRGSPYPSFMNFDATARTACTIKRSRSNTPLQALTLLNDPVYVEAALALAQRVLKELPDGSTDERLRHAFQLCVTRPPNREELAALRTLLDVQTTAYRSDAKAAKAAIGKYQPPTNSNEAELAAWHAIATTLLNLDEMITK